MGGQRIPWHGEAMGRFFSRMRHRGVPERERVPNRCNASGAAVDVCSDAPAWAQRAERAEAYDTLADLQVMYRFHPAPQQMAQIVTCYDR